MLLLSDHRQFRSPLSKKPPSCRGIVRSDVLVCFSGLLEGIGLFLHKIVLYFRECWFTVFNLPLPVPFAFSSEDSRTVVVSYFGVCRYAVFHLPLPVPFALSSECSRTVAVLSFRVCCFPSTTAGSVCFLSAAVTELSWYCTFGFSLGLRLFTGSSVIYFSTAGPACLSNRRPPNCRDIVPVGFFAIGGFFLLSATHTTKKTWYCKTDAFAIFRQFSATVSTGLLFVKDAESWCYSKSTMTFCRSIFLPFLLFLSCVSDIRGLSIT